MVAAAAALVALHTVLDTLVFPERGTTWADHLTAAVVPLGLLAAGALLYRRLPAGGRAALMAVLGALMSVGGALALADVQAPPVRGSSMSGLLLGPVGLVLVGLAALTAWRSRRPGRYRYLRRGLIAAACAILAFWLVVPVAVALVAVHRPRQSPGPQDLGRPVRSVTIHTRDGLDLAASYVPSRNGAAVISFPTRAGRTGQARFLADHGYGVLLLDMRGYDGSEGAPNAFGWGAAKDLDAAVAWLRARPDIRDGRIGGIGFSVGAEQLLEAAARNPGLRAVVADGAGERSVRESLIRGPRGWPSLPRTSCRPRRWRCCRTRPHRRRWRSSSPGSHPGRSC